MAALSGVFGGIACFLLPVCVLSIVGGLAFGVIGLSVGLTISVCSFIGAAFFSFLGTIFGFIGKDPKTGGRPQGFKMSLIALIIVAIVASPLFIALKANQKSHIQQKEEAEFREEVREEYSLKYESGKIPASAIKGVQEEAEAWIKRIEENNSSHEFKNNKVKVIRIYSQSRYNNYRDFDHAQDYVLLSREVDYDGTHVEFYTYMLYKGVDLLNDTPRDIDYSQFKEPDGTIGPTIKVELDNGGFENFRGFWTIEDFEDQMIIHPLLGDDYACSVYEIK